MLFSVHVQARVDPSRDIIYVNGNRLPKRQPPKVYLALNKPKGFVAISDAFLEASDFNSDVYL